MKTNPFLSCVLKVEERISVNRKEKSETSLFLFWFLYVPLPPPPSFLCVIYVPKMR